MTPDSTLADLLGRARSDPRGLDLLFQHCRNYLALIARTQVEGRLKTKLDASDLVQQTLLEAYRDFQRFQGTTPREWLAWLQKILSHNAANFVRHFHGTQGRDPRRELPADGLPSWAELSDPHESPSQAMVRKEREILLADAIARLPADYQEVILLRNLQRLSFEEVAQRMERSRPAVQMLWMRALEKLQETLRTAEWVGQLTP